MQRPNAILYFLRRGTPIGIAIYGIFSFIVSPILSIGEYGRRYTTSVVVVFGVGLALVTICTMLSMLVGALMELVATIEGDRQDLTLLLATAASLTLIYMLLFLMPGGIIAMLVILPMFVVLQIVNWRYWHTLTPVTKKKRDTHATT